MSDSGLGFAIGLGTASGWETAFEKPSVTVKATQTAIDLASESCWSIETGLSSEYDSKTVMNLKTLKETGMKFFSAILSDSVSQTQNDSVMVKHSQMLMQIVARIATAMQSSMHSPRATARC